jgi:predicted permease
MLEILWRDLLYAGRGLRRSPGFAIAAVVTLALGIGANAAMFSLVDAVMLRRLPIPSPEQLMLVRETDSTGHATEADLRRMLRFSYPRFTDLRHALPPSAHLAAMTRAVRLSIRTGSGPASLAQCQLVSGSYFDTFGATARAGRLLADGDDTGVDQQAVAVISEGYWRRALGADPRAVGRALSINGQPMTLVGIVAAPFTGPFADVDVDIWVPTAMQNALRYKAAASTPDYELLTRPWGPQDAVKWVQLVARVPGDAGVARLVLERANRAGLERLAVTIPDATERARVLSLGIALDPLSRGFSSTRDQYGRALVILAVIVGLVLLVAAVNVANLLLARAEARRREFAIRLSLGGTRWRLIRQCLAEALLLAAAGGGAGLLLGQVASHAGARLIAGTTIDRLAPVLAPDARVMAFTATVSLVVAVIIGLLPGLRSADNETLRQTSRASARVRGMQPLVAVQLALSVMVVTTAVLLGRTLVNLVQLDPGFERNALVSVNFDANLSGFPDAEAGPLYDRLLGTVKRLPGVTAASISMLGILSNDNSVSDYVFEGAGGTTRGEATGNLVGPDYFRTVGIKVISGRALDAHDMSSSANVAVVNEALARRYFGERSPIGRRLGEDTPDIVIVGVVRDARVRGVRTLPVPTVYLPLEDHPMGHRLEVRVTGDADMASAAIRTAVTTAEPGLALLDVTPMRAQVARDVARDRDVAWLAGAFGAVAVLLACIGLYGVLSYSVHRRTPEIGVRVAVGATPRDVTTLVLGGASRFIAGGVAAGIAGAYASRALLRDVLFGVDASDPWTYVTVALLLAAVSLVASALPARRAARVDPVLALRTE